MVAYLIHGRYTSRGSLGAGATSHVLRARDELLGGDVALKLFDGDLTQAAREFLLLRSLDHPGIARARECGLEWHSGRFFFCTEVVTGSDFVTAARKLTEHDQYVLFAHVLRVLQFLHSRGIVHRDIKPENLLVSDLRADAGWRERCPVRLIDFGLARATSDAGDLGGSLPYMAPEILD